MAGIWIYSEDTIIAQQIITLGRELAGKMQQPVCALTMVEQDAQTLIAAGADKVIVLKGDNAWPESYAAAVAGQAAQQQPTVLFVGATLRGKDLAAKIAATLKTGLITDAQKVQFVDGALETERMLYGGLAVCTEVLNGMNVITIPPRAYDVPPQDPSRSGEVVAVDVQTESTMAVGNVCPIVRKGADIAVAEKLVCIGRGLAKQEDMQLAQDLATAIGAEMCCTRSVAEDYHWMPVEAYVGLSGQKVKPIIYLSMGVSGQIQHVAGIRDSKLIVAIDTNENAPIFAAADYGIVGDLYQVVPLLTEAIKNKA
ncbi:MAG: Electron transfer flavoprotein alpha subunit [Firmicutes bacterium]|nr:Electron transfer flavoprotein alpha subunit [Bacillota bacterium]